MNRRNLIGNWIVALVLLLAPTSWGEEIITPSFAEFDRRARAGATLSVVFFGGALTWGDGASDPERTSFRALLKNYLEGQYPSAQFSFHDSAIGATGSRLGMFRIQRDVLAHNPDLVFIDFTTEDKLHGTDRKILASYEQILRDLIFEGVPVVQVLLGEKKYFGADWTHLGPQRLRDHHQMGILYRTAIGDSFPAIQKYLQREVHHRNDIWPTNQTDPSDLGHRYIFDAVRDALELAIRDKRICNYPREGVFANEYKNRSQIFPSTLKIPAGWRVAKTLRPVVEAVKMANAWKNEVVIWEVGAPEQARPLLLNFNGSFLGILGEADEHGLGFRVLVDGKVIPYKEKPLDEVWPTSTRPFGGGERFFWHEITDQLSPGRHAVEIHPVIPAGVERGALRIESVCVAGPDPETAQVFSAFPLK